MPMGHGACIGQQPGLASRQHVPTERNSTKLPAAPRARRDRPKRLPDRRGRSRERRLGRPGVAPSSPTLGIRARGASCSPVTRTFRPDMATARVPGRPASLSQVSSRRRSLARSKPAPSRCAAADCGSVAWTFGRRRTLTIGGPCASSPRRPILVRWKVGGGRCPRQTGQVRKEAAVTSSAPGRSPAFRPPVARFPPLRPCPAVRASTGLVPSRLSGARAQLPSEPALGADRPGGARAHADQCPGSGRVAHAFMLSGIRGVGKTTTARIIARGLNCTGPDGRAAPRPSPAASAPSCRRWPRTGRSTSSRWMPRPIPASTMSARSSARRATRPLAARYKVYIIDEVHMLSRRRSTAF